MPKPIDKSQVQVPASAVLLSPKQVCTAYGFSLNYWQDLRSRGAGPKFHKYGNRILYVRRSVEEYLGVREVV